VSDVIFGDNTLYLKSVGFYAVPLIVAETNGYGGLDAPKLISNGTNPATPSGTSAGWYDVLSTAALQSSGFDVVDNQFIVDIDSRSSRAASSCIHSLGAAG
jgi:hypothetical protein